MKININDKDLKLIVRGLFWVKDNYKKDSDRADKIINKLFDISINEKLKNE